MADPVAGVTVAGVTGRVALVTGAAGDFGRVIAEHLARAGARLVVADRTEAAEPLAATVAALRELGAEAVAASFDVTDPDAVAVALEASAAALGPVELLVNNAGYQGTFANVLDYPVDDARRVLDVNVFGAFVVLQAAARQMVRMGDRGGAVVNVASMAGVSGAANMPAYAASKAAIAGLTRAASKDLAPRGIRVNAVSPGFIGPGVMWDKQVAEQAAIPSPYYGDDPETVAAQMVGSVPLGRYGSVDEVAATIVYLLSDAAGFVSGQELALSGGGA